MTVVTLGEVYAECRDVPCQHFGPGPCEKYAHSLVLCLCLKRMLQLTEGDSRLPDKYTLTLLLNMLSIM